MIPNKRKILSKKEMAGYGIPLLAMYSNSSSESMISTHDHGSLFEICYLKRGTQNYCIDNDEYSLQGGDVFITLPGERHSTGNNPQARGCLYWIHIDSNCANLLGLDPQSSNQVIKQLYALKTRKFQIREDVATKLIQAYSLVEDGGVLELIEAKALLVVFICELLECGNREDSKNDISDSIMTAKKYIDDNIKEKLVLSNISEMVCFSLSHFKSKFKKEIGVPPGEYIMQKKIYDSVSLLPEKTLTYIAYEYNYSSPQHYSKNFKAVTGLTPKEYKHRMINSDKQ